MESKLNLWIMYKGVLIPDDRLSINGWLTGAVLEFSVRDFLYKSKEHSLSFYNESNGHINLDFAIMGWSYQKQRKETVYGAIGCMITASPDWEENGDGKGPLAIVKMTVTVD